MLWATVAFLAVCVLCVLLMGCRTQFVPVETVRTEYQNHTDTVRHTDSIIRERETVVRETNNGDSALLAPLDIELRKGQRAVLVLQKELERISSEQREAAHDTIIQCDTITVVQQVEKPPNRWQQTRQRLGDALLWVLAAAVAYVALRKWMKSK
jgi:hypothetical protein